MGKNTQRDTNSLLFLLLVKQPFYAFTADLLNLENACFTPSLNVIQRTACA